MFRHSLVALFGLGLASAAFADTKPRPKLVPMTSKTTGLYPSKTCKEKGKAGEGQDPALICPGLPGFTVDVWFSAEDTHVEISNKAGKSVSFGGKVGDKLEWRHAGGKPFAVIVAVDNKLLVRGLPGYESVTGDIADKPDGWKRARELADTAYRNTMTKP